MPRFDSSPPGVPFAKGPDSRRFGGGRSPLPRVTLPDGKQRTLAEIAREGTWDAVQVLRECVNDESEDMSVRCRAAGYLLSLGWGDAPKALQVTAVTDTTRAMELTDADLFAMIRLQAPALIKPEPAASGPEREPPASGSRSRL